MQFVVQNRSGAAAAGLQLNVATTAGAKGVTVQMICERYKVAEIEAKRNAILVDMMKLFKKHKIGSGLVLDRELKARKKKAKKT